MTAARFTERKQFAIAAIEQLTYAADSDALTPNLIHAIRALAGLMPTQEADGAIEGIADDFAHDMATAKEFADPDLPFWNEADFRHEMQLCDVRVDARGGVWL